MKIGPYSVSSVVSHSFALDGGAMFGVVPKPLWERSLPADERNRIPMVTRLLLLESSDAKILIDLGCGDKFNSKMSDIYKCVRRTSVPLHEVVPQVTHVLITHLHFDHVGGVSYYDAGGSLATSFPNAQHLVPRRQWEYAKDPNVREKASFLPENLTPLNSVTLRCVDDAEEVAPNIRVWESNGHTPGMLWVEIFDESATLVFPSDLMPTSHHVPLPYVMGYDMCARTIIEEKDAFLKKAVENNWIVVFEHDRDLAAARLAIENGRAKVREEVQIPEITS